MRTPCRTISLFLSAVLSLASLPSIAAPPLKPQVPNRNFSFIHISDSHVSPYLKMPSDSELSTARSYAVVQGIRDVGETVLTQPPLTIPKPSFLVHTGDIAEFSQPGVTWDVVEKYFFTLGLPVSFAPGNHDFTWVATPEYFRKAYGGTNHSFDAGGIHFVSIASATLQDPRPSFGEEVIQFLRRDLAKAGTKVPVFLALHHPLNSTELCSRYDTDRLLDTLRPYNVALILYGHGHSAVKKEFGGIDAIQGGSPFATRDKSAEGYNVVCVNGDRITAAYRSAKEGVPPKVLIDKRIQARPDYPAITVDSPGTGKPVAATTLDIRATIDAGGHRIARAWYEIDDDKDATGTLKLSAGRAGATTDIGNLANGAHFVRVNFAAANGKTFSRSARFHVERPGAATARWRFQMTGASKATPLVHDGRVYVGANDGFFYALDAATGKLAWKLDAGAEILSTAAAHGGLILFGTAKGELRAVTTDGKPKWAWKTGDAVFSSPVVDADGIVYIGTNGARLVALKASTGEVVWENTDARYGIESPPCIADGRVIFGAWDGYVYSIDRKTGKLAWKSPGPRNAMSDKAPNHYYAPADCGPVALGDTVVVTDRGYVAGRYSRDGAYIDTITSNCAAISASADRQALYLRPLKGPLVKMDAAGQHEIWKSDIPQGSLPVPPAEVDGGVYTCSNNGILSAVNAASGALKWQYRVTPQLYVMSGVGTDAKTVYTTALDGFVTAIEPPKP
jgi:outer membrane protein assembly factor BamB